MKAQTLTPVILMSMVAAAFAGYSFPVEAENFAIDKFKTLKPSQEVDETNFLVDLSGRYSKCIPRGALESGRLEVNERTPEDRPIQGVIDTVRAPASDSDSLTSYIQTTLTRWTKDEPFRSRIQDNNRHGCSIQPECNGYAVIVCLFSSV